MRRSNKHCYHVHVLGNRPSCRVHNTPVGTRHITHIPVAPPMLPNTHSVNVTSTCFATCYCDPAMCIRAHSMYFCMASSLDIPARTPKWGPKELGGWVIATKASTDSREGSYQTRTTYHNAVLLVHQEKAYQLPKSPEVSARGLSATAASCSTTRQTRHAHTHGALLLTRRRERGGACGYTPQPSQPMRWRAVYMTPQSAPPQASHPP